MSVRRGLAEIAGRRGWERPDALEHFERFVAAVVAHFGGRAELWCTLNEPMVCVRGLVSTVCFRRWNAAVIRKRSYRHKPLLRATRLRIDCSKKMRRAEKTVQVGIAQHVRSFQPLRNHHPLDRLTAQLVEQAFVWDFSMRFTAVYFDPRR